MSEYTHTREVIKTLHEAQSRSIELEKGIVTVEQRKHVAC